MKPLSLLLFAFSFACTAQAQKDSVPTLKTILLAQFKSTHDVKDWFVPASLSVQGLTAQQANWKDSSENHSIAQLATHLIFGTRNCSTNLKVPNRLRSMAIIKRPLQPWMRPPGRPR